MGGQGERTVWPEISTADWAANTSYVFKDAGNYFCLPLPLPSPVPCEARLFNSAQQLPCNSVPQCQVMQPQILFLSISQYIHNSSSGRYNGFTETLRLTEETQLCVSQNPPQTCLSSAQLVG